MPPKRNTPPTPSEPSSDESDSNAEFKHAYKYQPQKKHPRLQPKPDVEESQADKLRAMQERIRQARAETEGWETKLANSKSGNVPAEETSFVPAISVSASYPGQGSPVVAATEFAASTNRIAPVMDSHPSHHVDRAPSNPVSEEKRLAPDGNRRQSRVKEPPAPPQIDVATSKGYRPMEWLKVNGIDPKDLGIMIPQRKHNLDEWEPIITNSTVRIPAIVERNSEPKRQGSTAQTVEQRIGNERKKSQSRKAEVVRLELKDQNEEEGEDRDRNMSDDGNEFREG